MGIITVNDNINNTGATQSVITKAAKAETRSKTDIETTQQDVTPITEEQVACNKTNNIGAGNLQ